MAYKVITADGLGNIQNLVNELISDGWKPQGGISVLLLENPGSGGAAGSGEYIYRFFQAMVKE